MIYNDPMLRKEKAQKVTLTLTGNVEYAGYVQVGGTQYVSDSVLAVDIGTELVIYLDPGQAQRGEDAYVQINGVTVASSPFGGGDPINYIYSVTTNCEIALGYVFAKITESPSTASGGTDK